MSAKLSSGVDLEPSNSGSDDRLPVEKARLGDRDAVALLIQKFELPVEIIAKRYVRSGVLQDDLIQEGKLGILEAIKRYDSSLGYKFSTYVVWWIRQKISRYFQDNGRTVRIPNDIFYGTKTFERALMAFYAENGRFLTDAEMMDKWGYTEEELALMKEKVQLLNFKTISFDQESRKTDDDSKTEYEFHGSDDIQFSTVIDDRACDQFLDQLRASFFRQFGDRVRKKVTADQEFQIFLDRFGFNAEQCDYSQPELGRRHNLSREGVSHIEDKILGMISGNRILLNGLRELGE